MAGRVGPGGVLKEGGGRSHLGNSPTQRLLRGPVSWLQNGVSCHQQPPPPGLSWAPFISGGGGQDKAAFVGTGGLEPGGLVIKPPLGLLPSQVQSLPCPEPQFP